MTTIQFDVLLRKPQVDRQQIGNLTSKNGFRQQNFDITDIESLRLTKASLLMHQNLAETQLVFVYAKLNY